MIDTSTLNQKQLEAVHWDNGPLLVLAGPGTGKTRVLTYRIAHLIESTPDKDFKILGLTFTDAAAEEMRKRISDLVPNSKERTRLATFHSFAAELLRRHGHHIGLTPDFTILVEDLDCLPILDEAIKSANAENYGWKSKEILPLISRLTENDATPKMALEELRNSSFKYCEKFVAVYEKYRSLMRERNSLDFPGLIGEALRLLKNNPDVCRQIQETYPYICVDEFQDTNLSQYNVLRQLVNAKSKNLFVVADEDQIIYQWRGADPERLKTLRREFGMDLHQLQDCYRCPPEVVELANRLISRNSVRHSRKDPLKAHKSESKNPVVATMGLSYVEEEADWVADSIAGRPKEELAKCAVLARTREFLEPVVAALKKRGICGHLATRNDQFASDPLRWLHSVLRLAVSRNSREHLDRACLALLFLEPVSLTMKDANDGDYLRSYAEEVLRSDETSDPLKKFIRESLVPILVDGRDFRQFKEHAFRYFDDLQNIKPDDRGLFEGYTEEKETWHRLVREISLKYGGKDVSLHQLLQEMDNRSKSPEPPTDSVPCLTIHAAKGREFDHVYLVRMTESGLPNLEAKLEGDHGALMEEERRLCFVAITRAQETLTMTYSERVDGWQMAPSRFLREMKVI